MERAGGGYLLEERVQHIVMEFLIALSNQYYADMGFINRLRRRAASKAPDYDHARSTTLRIGRKSNSECAIRIAFAYSPPKEK